MIKPMLKRKKILIRILVLLVLLFVIFTIWINIAVSVLGNKYAYDSVEKIPHNHCALVLGTSKYLSNGHQNLYYLNRIKAAVDLYNNKKIDFIIVSGDNRNKNYNEPLRMYNDLVAVGIPKNKIFLDYAGFRTLDSVIRGKEVFGQDNFTIVSQPFHNQRAIFIARKKGINAIAFNADDVSDKESIEVRIREIGARILVAFDLLIERQPHFLGERVIIPVE
jgi:SanA protein